MFAKKENKIQRDVLDVEEFFTRVQRDKKLLMEVLDIFIEDFRKKRKELETAVSSKDNKQMIHLAHSLKGACANIAAKNLRRNCVAIEQVGMNNDWDHTAPILQGLDRNFEELLASIAQLKNNV